MPGIIYTEDEMRRGPRSPKHEINVSGMYPGMANVRPTQYDSRRVVPRPMAHTTGYGLNEPQWSEGPPPIIFQNSPYSRVPLPPLSAHPITINPLLSPFGPASIVWTIDQHPQAASCTAGLNQRDQYHWKLLPAMIPGDAVSLTIQIYPFRTPIVISPRASVITVGEVLAAVYHGVRRGATEIFCQELRVSPDVMWTAAGDYSRLVTQDAGPVLGDDEVSANVRSYMDFHTRWVGLIPSPTERDVWIHPSLHPAILLQDTLIRRTVTHSTGVLRTSSMTTHGKTVIF